MKYFLPLFLFINAALRAASSEPLDAVVADIVAKNPELAFYQAEIEAAQAGQRAAGTRANPELELSLGRKRVTDASGILAGEGTAWSVTLSQTFDWPGRLPLRKAIANHDLTLAELGLARFQAALAARARTLAYSLHAAQERAAATAEVAARYRMLRELFLARDPGGITPLLETRVIEAQELALQHRATAAQLAVQSSLVELNQLRGTPTESPLEITPIKLAFNPAPASDVLLAAARENNFEFRAAKLELEQQGLVVSLARHEGKSDVTLSPYYSQENAGDRERSFGVGVSMPLPISRRNSANVATAEARRRQAESAVLIAQRTLEREILSAAHTFSAKLGETAQWSPDAAKKFREAAELADRHYRLGAVPIATYVEMQSAYLDAVEALLDTQQETMEAGLKLQQLTGLNFNAVELAP